MKIAFTGTQRGLTAPQLSALENELHRLDRMVPGGIAQAHHGDCIGGDATFDALCAQRAIMRVAHPGRDLNGESPKRAWCDAERVLEPEHYLQRNALIVLAGDVLLACPHSVKEQPRGSGTWQAVRAARRFGKPVTLIYPDGRVEHERGSKR